MKKSLVVIALVLAVATGAHALGTTGQQDGTSIRIPVNGQLDWFWSFFR